MIFLELDKMASRVAAIGLVAFAAAGCTTVVTTPQGLACNMTTIHDQRDVKLLIGPDGKGDPLAMVPLNSVSMLDASIVNKVYVRDAIGRRTATGTVQIQSQVANCTDFPLQIEARAQFYDANNAPSEPVSAWKRVYLSPRSNGTYIEASLGTGAVQSYVIEVREGR